MIEQIDATALVEGARLAGMLPYLNETLSKMEQALNTRIYTLLNKNELTPEVALYAWQEKHVLNKLRKSFNMKVRLGEAVAERNAPELEWSNHG
jgi:hypothetical protein